MPQSFKRMTPAERAAKVVLALVLTLLGLVALYPFLYVISMAFSAPEHVLKRDVFFFPKGLGLDGFKLVAANKNLWPAYGNTIFYTVVGTLINLFVTVLISYALSRQYFVLRKSLSLMITFTMFFSGGMIPFFLVISNLGLYNTRWAVLLPFAASAWNIIIARSFYEQIPESLIESARIDGANDLQILGSIVLPLSGPILSVLTLFYAVGHWNSYFPAMLFISKPALQPVQVYLIRVLIQNSEALAEEGTAGYSRALVVEQLKYSVIIVTILPIVVLYPFLQKYFVQGVMIGAIKG